jgi:RHS repeat-associated protein
MAKTYLFWDPLSDNILQERDETGAVTAEYTTEPGLYGNVISQNRGGAESQFHYDAQGSTLAVTDDNQQVTDTRAYSAFGETTESTGSTSFPFQYIGQKGYYRDGLTGQYIVRRRSYEPVIARWFTVDPLRNINGTTLYTYVGLRAVVAIDPSGYSFTIVRPPTPVGMGWYDWFQEGDPEFPSEAITELEASLSCVCELHGGGTCSVSCYLKASFRILINTALIDCLNGRHLDRLTVDELNNCLRLRRLYYEYSFRIPTLEDTYGHEQRHVQSLIARFEELARRLEAEELAINKRRPCCRDCVTSAASLSSFGASAICHIARREAHLPTHEANPFPSPQSEEPYPPLEDTFPNRPSGTIRSSGQSIGDLAILLNGRQHQCFPDVPSNGDIPRPSTTPPTD